MAEEFEHNERIWRCACFSSPHFLSIVADATAPEVSQDERSWGWVTVEVTDGPMAFRARLREAWKILRSTGHRYFFAEVLLNPESAREVRDLLSSLLDQMGQGPGNKTNWRRRVRTRNPAGYGVVDEVSVVDRRCDPSRWALLGHFFDLRLSLVETHGGGLLHPLRGRVSLHRSSRTSSELRHPSLGFKQDD
jgi:hypothetical protein